MFGVYLFCLFVGGIGFGFVAVVVVYGWFVVRWFCFVLFSGCLVVGSWVCCLNLYGCTWWSLVLCEFASVRVVFLGFGGFGVCSCFEWMVDFDLCFGLGFWDFGFACWDWLI